MSWVAWIVIGLLAGIVAKMVMPGTKEEPSGFLGTTLLGIVGAVVGGWIWNFFLGQPGANGINLGSLFVAFVGSCIVLGVMQMLDRSPHAY